MTLAPLPAARPTVIAHALAAFATLAALARAGRVAAHRRTMAALYGSALAITGVLTLMPERIMRRVLFG